MLAKGTSPKYDLRLDLASHYVYYYVIYLCTASVTNKVYSNEQNALFIIIGFGL